MTESEWANLPAGLQTEQSHLFEPLNGIDRFGRQSGNRQTCQDIRHAIACRRDGKRGCFPLRTSRETRSGGRLEGLSAFGKSPFLLETSQSIFSLWAVGMTNVGGLIAPEGILSDVRSMIPNPL